MIFISSTVSTSAYVFFWGLIRGGWVEIIAWGFWLFVEQMICPNLDLFVNLIVSRAAAHRPAGTFDGLTVSTLENNNLKTQKHKSNPAVNTSLGGKSEGADRSKSGTATAENRSESQVVELLSPCYRHRWSTITRHHLKTTFYHYLIFSWCNTDICGNRQCLLDIWL